MNEINQLRQQIYSTTQAPRELLVIYIKELVKEAKQLPPFESEARLGPAGLAGKFTQTTREDIAAEVLGCLLHQDWISYDMADDLEEIIEIASSLDISVDDDELWRELFEKADNLS